MTPAPAPIPRKHFYAAPGGGIQYDTADEMAAWLFAHPMEVDDYNLAMYRLAQSVAAWNDYATMRETFNLLVDVMIALAKLRGEQHRE